MRHSHHSALLAYLPALVGPCDDGRFLEPLVSFAATLGFTTSFEDVAGCAGGFCDSRAKRIFVDSGAPANGRVRTLGPRDRARPRG